MLYVYVYIYVYVMLYVYYASICYNRKFRWTIEESARTKVLQKSGRCIRITFLDSLSSIFLDLPRGTRPRLGILFYFISPPPPSLYNRIERLETRIPAIHRGGTARHRE